MVTAHHVIEDSDAVDVTAMSQTYKGTLLGYSSDHDVAVLSICCNAEFHFLPWEDGGSAAAGASVLAIGYPRNVLVSTIGTVQTDSLGDVLNLVSHDAPLQAGSSGGPLFAMDGKVLGINTGSSKITEGLFYAVPYEVVSEEVVKWKSRLVVVPLTPAPNQPTSSDLTLSGMGDKELFWEIQKGRYVATATVNNNNERSFSMDFEHILDGETWFQAEFGVNSEVFTYLVNVGNPGDPYDQREMLAGRQLVKIGAEGTWTITFEAVN